jgi:hypothetical protein
MSIPTYLLFIILFYYSNKRIFGKVDLIRIPGRMFHISLIFKWLHSRILIYLNIVNNYSSNIIGLYPSINK